MIDQGLHGIGPPAMEHRMSEQVQGFPRSLRLTAEQGATRHILQHFHAPAVLHAILDTDTVAVVKQAVLIVEHAGSDVVEHINGKRRIALLVNDGEVVDLIEQTT